VRATNGVAAAVEVALLVLAEAVVVLVLGRGEGCADAIEGVVGGTPASPSLWLGMAISQPRICNNVSPAGVLTERFTPGVEPPKNFAMSACVPVGV